MFTIYQAHKFYDYVDVACICQACLYTCARVRVDGVAGRSAGLLAVLRRRPLPLLGASRRISVRGPRADWGIPRHYQRATGGSHTATVLTSGRVCGSLPHDKTAHEFTPVRARAVWCRIIPR